MGGAGSKAKMRAAQIVRPREVRVVEVDRPKPGPGEVLFRVEGCGVCGSNLAVWEGQPWFEYPRPPGEGGHEAWGVIEEIGEGVDGLWPGYRVVALSYRAFAELDVARAEHVLRVPRSVNGAPLPAEAMACAYNVFERAEIRAGHAVAVVGVGFLGAMVAQIDARAGARVVAISRRRFALEVARRLGADAGVTMDDPATTLAAAKEANRGALFDVVVEAAGVQGALDLASELVRERGRLVVAGYHQDGPRQVNMQLWNWRGIDVINAHERDPRRYLSGTRRALGAVVSGSLDPSVLCTHRFPLDENGEALEAVRRRPAGFLKGWVEP